MNHYEQACKWHESASSLISNEFYQQSVYHSCLAGELYLKSALSLVEHDSILELSHDIIGLYAALARRYGKTAEMIEATNFMRKYFNETRYPSMNIEFTKQIALDFKNYTDIVKNYVDSCTGTPEDLAKHFNKQF